MTALATSQLRDLLRACRLGDEAAARALHAAVSPSMRLYARALLAEDALALDATQQAFLRLLKTPRDTVEAIRDPLAWLLSLVRSEALTIRRTRRRAALREADAMPPMRDHARSDATTLDDAIRRLADSHREILILKHACALTFDQVAMAAGLTRSTTATRHKAALEALRKELAHSSAVEVEHAR